jgi:hypothetical protein
LPYDLQVTPLLRHQSGNNFGRTFVGALNYGNPTILAEEFDAERFRNITIFDTHVEKAIRVRGTRVAGFFDVYNIFNSNPEFSFTTSSGSSWMRPLSIVSPRIARFGARFEW